VGGGERGGDGCGETSAWPATGDSVTSGGEGLEEWGARRMLDCGACSEAERGQR
jgi:hypothetical protein